MSGVAEPIGEAAAESRLEAGARSGIGALAAACLPLAGMLVVAAYLRFDGLAFQSLSDDEGYSFALSQRSFTHMFGLFRWEGNGTLYSVVLWPLVRLSDSLEVLRLPAALAGVAAVAATYWAGRELASRRVALTGALLLAVNPMAVRYADFARPFSFVLLFSALSLALLGRHLRTGGRAPLVGYAVVLALAAYSNSLAPILLVPVHLLLTAPAGRAALRRVELAIAGAVVLAGPVIALAVVESGRRDPLYWLTRPGPGRIASVAEEFMLGRARDDAWTVRTAVAVAVLVTAALIVAQVRWSRANRSWPLPLFAWTFLPFVIALGISVVRPVFFGAYLIVALPGLCLLLAAGASRLGPRPSAVLVGLLVLAWGTSAFAMSRLPRINDYRSATAWIATQRPHADPLIIDPIPKLPGYGYYDPALRAPDGHVVVKEWGDEPMPSGVSGFTDPGGYGNAPAGPPTVAYVRGLAGQTGRVVLVVDTTFRQGDVAHGPAARWLGSHCTVVTRDFGGIIVLAARGCRPAAA
jgi:4-amino-4-deoxy-L-arabinose transferase-like glycosyltransferase